MQVRKSAPKISKYAYGKDYHEIIRPKLNFILTAYEEKFSDFHGRGFVDSAPVLKIMGCDPADSDGSEKRKPDP
jgi:epoxyqueuosine reductase